MEPEEIDFMQSNHLNLVNAISAQFSDFISHLFQEKILDRNQYDAFRESPKTKQELTKDLLMVLIKVSGAFQKLQEICRADDFSNIARLLSYFTPVPRSPSVGPSTPCNQGILERLGTLELAVQSDASNSENHRNELVSDIRKDIESLMKRVHQLESRPQNHTEPLSPTLVQLQETPSQTDHVAFSVEIIDIPGKDPTWKICNPGGHLNVNNLSKPPFTVPRDGKYLLALSVIKGMVNIRRKENSEDSSESGATIVLNTTKKRGEGFYNEILDLKKGDELINYSSNKEECKYTWSVALIQ